GRGLRAAAEAVAGGEKKLAQAGKHPSAAKAAFISEPSTARLKSCPFKASLIQSFPNLIPEHVYPLRNRNGSWRTDWQLRPYSPTGKRPAKAFCRGRRFSIS